MAIRIDRNNGKMVVTILERGPSGKILPTRSIEIDAEDTPARAQALKAFAEGTSPVPSETT